MTPFAQSILIWAVTNLLAALAGWLTANRRRRRTHDDAIDAGVRVLLLCELERQQRELVAGGATADNESKARAQTVYDAYQALGGNGHGTQINQDIQNMPIAPKRTNQT